MAPLRRTKPERNFGFLILSLSMLSHPLFGAKRRVQGPGCRCPRAPCLLHGKQTKTVRLAWCDSVGASRIVGQTIPTMKRLTFALVATVLAAAPIVASANDSTPSSPATRTAALLASGADVRVNQVNVEVRTDDPNYHHPYYNHHHRRYHTVKVVRYRDGVRYVTYRRVYYRDNS